MAVHHHLHAVGVVGLGALDVEEAHAIGVVRVALRGVLEAGRDSARVDDQAALEQPAPEKQRHQQQPTKKWRKTDNEQVGDLDTRGYATQSPSIIGGGGQKTTGAKSRCAMYDIVSVVCMIQGIDILIV